MSILWHCTPEVGAVTERGTIPCPRSGAVAGRSNPMSKKLWLHRHRRAERSYSMVKVRRGSH